MKRKIVGLLMCLHSIVGEGFCQVDHLELHTVLDSVQQHHPSLLKELARVEEADAGIVEAQGVYDVQFSSKNYSYLSGFYTGSSTESSIDIPVDLAMGTLSTFYRRGSGTLPVYEDEYQTLDSGEVGIKYSMSVLRDWKRDRRQLAVELAEYDKRLAEFSRTARIVALERMAVEYYWTWVFQAKKVEIYKALLSIASERQQQLDTRVQAGGLAELEALDNKRTIMKRKAILVHEEAILQKYANGLSLFYRNQAGEPVVPTDAQVPHTLPEVTECSVSLPQLKQVAFRERQDISALNTKLSQLGVKRSFQDTRFLPDVTVSSSVTRDYGAGSDSREGTEMKVFLNLSVPFQQRKNRGKLSQTQAKIGQYSASREFLKNKVGAELANLLTMISQSKERFTISKQELSLTRRMEAGEKEKFKTGASSLLFVAIRELASANAEVQLLDIHRENLVLRAQLEAASGSRQQDVNARCTM